MKSRPAICHRQQSAALGHACAWAIESLESRTLLTTFTPVDGPALSNVLNGSIIGGKSLQLGDTIILQAGNTYTGEFTLKNITAGSGYITIQSSNLANLPDPGQRVSPADAVNMPKLISIGSNAPVVDTAASANHYQFIGIEFMGAAPAAHNSGDLVTLVELGDSTSAQSTLAVVPHHINLDRCYLHPYWNQQTIRRAIALHDDYSDITNCYIEEIHEGSDSNAIIGWNGVGHYNIINNHLEGAGENILFGGATRYLPGVTSDVVIRGNHVIKPLSWRGVWICKNLFELKHGARFTVEGNIFENCWEDGQYGSAINLKLGDWDVSPQNLTEDILFQNNVVRHANGAITLQGRDYQSNSPYGLVRRITIQNNLFDDINGYWSLAKSGRGWFNIFIAQGPVDVTIDHNTFQNAYTTIEVDASNETYPATNFKFTNNIVSHSLYGVRSGSTADGNATFTKFFNDGTTAQAQARITKNAVMIADGGSASAWSNRPGNYFPAAWADVKFVDQANADYHLQPTSPYHNAATDGTDVGANMDIVNGATATATTGVGDTTPPTVTAWTFQNQVSPPALWVTFSEPVAALSASSIKFTNVDFPNGSTPTVSSVQWDAATNTAKFILTTPILNGDFTAALAGVHDLNINPLVGSAGTSFWFLNGDATADQKVNAMDMNALASHFGKTGATFAEGDFTFNGIVDSADFTVLAQNFGKTPSYVPPPPPPPPPPASYSEQVLRRNPLLYLKLNESSGTVAADSSGNGYAGTLDSTDTLGQASASSQLGTSIKTPGTTTNNTAVPVKITSSSAITALNAIGTGSFSVEFWINLSSISARQDLFDFRGGANSNDIGMQVSNTGAGVALGKLSVFHNNTAIILANGTNDPTVSTNVWHQLVLTRDATTHSEDVYYDGVHVTTSGTDTLGFTTDATGQFALGNKTSGQATPRLTLGMLDELAIYGSALSAADVLSDYNFGLGNAPAAASSVPLASTSAGNLFSAAQIQQSDVLDAQSAEVLN